MVLAFVCVNGSGICIYTSKKSDEVQRHFSMMQHHPNLGMDNGWKCSLEVEGSSYRCVFRIAIETLRVHHGIYSTARVNCNKVVERIATSSKPILGPVCDFLKNM